MFLDRVPVVGTPGLAEVLKTVVKVNVRGVQRERRVAPGDGPRDERVLRGGRFEPGLGVACHATYTSDVGPKVLDRIDEEGVLRRLVDGLVEAADERVVVAHLLVGDC